MTSNTSPGSGPRLGTGLFLISAAVLALQVLLTRVLSVQMWHHHSYTVVTMTLLGFAVAGSIVTVKPRLLDGDPRVRLAWCGVLFSISTIVGYLILDATAERASDLTEKGHFFTLGIFYSYLLVPYVFSGLVVVIALSVAKEVHKLYFVNLVGSALGAWLFILLVAPLGAERLLVVCAAAGPLAALAFLRGENQGESGAIRLPRFAAVVCLAGCLGLFAVAPSWLEVGVASNKAEADHIAAKIGAEPLETRWSSLCRLSMVQMPSGMINIYQDGDAITVMHSDESWKLEPPVALNTVGYLPHMYSGPNGSEDKRSEMDVLAIGIGGGIDLISACDMRYCAADAFFSIQETNIGLTADVGTLQRLPHILPHGIVRELTFTGRRMMAPEAREWGLVNQVFDDAKALQDGVMAIAAEIAAKSPIVTVGNKEMLNYARDHSIQDGLNYIATWNAAMLSRADIGEAFQAKSEKREPTYKDLDPTRKLA